MTNRPGFVDEEKLIASRGNTTLSESYKVFRLTFIHCDDVYMIEIPKNFRPSTITQWPNFLENALHGEMFKYPFTNTAYHIPHHGLEELPEEALRAIDEASLSTFDISRGKADYIIDRIPDLRESIEARKSAKIIQFPLAV